MATRTAPQSQGSAHPLNAPYQAFETSDGWISVGAANQANWERLVDLLGRPELKSDERYVSNERRMENRQVLEAELTNSFRTRTSAEWLDHLEAGGFPAGPILDVAEMHRDPQAVAREMVITTQHPIAGEAGALGLPVKFSATPGAVRGPAPLLGQHTREVLREAGYDDPALEKMFARGDIAETRLSNSKPA